MDSLPGLDAGREALRRFLAGEDDIDTMRTKLCALATDAIAGCDSTSITMLERGEPRTPAATDDLALALDEVQYRSGEGPCLSAIEHRGAEATSLGSEHRWPEFRVAAQERGVMAVLSTPLCDEDRVLGALNMYSTSVGTFAEASITAAALFADQLGIAAARATYLFEQHELAQHLRRALESRAVIDQAKGIVMANERCSPEAAFEILRRASQRENRKLRAIAQELVNKYATGGP